MDNQHKEVTSNDESTQSLAKEGESPTLDKITESKPIDSAQTSLSKLKSFRKKIKDHIFDFVLLFLAVFCGFMADNWRETLSEHQREKTFIRSIVEDVISDTLESNRTLNRLKMMNTGIDSVLVALLNPETIENSNNVFKLWTRNLGLEVFVSNDRTIQQLKSSGELRLIRKKEVSDRIMKYDQTLKRYYTQSNLMYNALTNLTYYSQLFDFISLSKDGKGPVPLTELGKASLNQAYAHLYLWNRGLEGLLSYLEVVNNEGKELVIFIQDHYKLNK
jgi:hypothetical protein